MTDGLSTADLVLATIAIALALSAFGAVATSVSVAVAMAAGSIPATGSIGYALFYNPPTDG
ncbi:hypothetical protein [Haloarcula salinisoli]|uniref:Uncharacterized protein n=1 Tax=Haloarcula salinisoli TaxID=2487746 RepID=A0A8J7YN51_9EURY|nr:hypothetical protein [Halomicroarcula salinisoli]MBX0287863.1 hypothetical protein [Halomicroarcula salinisoli]MBX0304806.1 hypothetical protein [Halomicroarcula salinisoli]